MTKVDSDSATVVEGLGDEVFYTLFVLGLSLIPVAYLMWALRTSHGRSYSVIWPIHVQPGEINTFSVMLNANLPNTCLERSTGQCITSYWRFGNWLGAVTCPVCRSPVTILLISFAEADPDEADRDAIVAEVRDYNRRFSGAARPIIDYVRDIPVLLPHLASRFFSLDGVMLMFRVRVFVCLLAAVLYVLSPLDLVPEAVFGVLGILDDLFILFIFAIYTTFAYRQFVASA